MMMGFVIFLYFGFGPPLLRSERGEDRSCTDREREKMGRCVVGPTINELSFD